MDQGKKTRVADYTSVYIHRSTVPLPHTAVNFEVLNLSCSTPANVTFTFVLRRALRPCILFMITSRSKPQRIHCGSTRPSLRIAHWPRAFAVKPSSRGRMSWIGGY